MKIGVFGGTFDPPHMGHLIVAEHAREELGLDTVLLVPSAISPHKRHDPLSDPVYRLEMVQLALMGQTSLQPSDVEVKRGGVSYTVDTLQQLRRMYPRDEFALFMGLDNLAEFTSWKSPAEILGLASVVGLTRPGFEGGEASVDVMKGVILCRVPAVEISSREIRERVRCGKSIRFLVPRTVESYIYYRKLYR
jgi:nicotinate-nucleotide adenylyltransferase